MLVSDVHFLGQPLPPLNISASELTTTSVTLTWSHGNTERVQSYIIQCRRKYSPDNYTDMVDVLTNQYTLSALRPDTMYEIRIVAINGFGQSQPSVTVDFITLTKSGTLLKLIISQNTEDR